MYRRSKYIVTFFGNKSRLSVLLFLELPEEEIANQADDVDDGQKVAIKNEKNENMYTDKNVEEIENAKKKQHIQHI